MKLCKNCKHYQRAEWGDGYYADVCVLRTPQEVNYVTGQYQFSRSEIVYIDDERKDSKGLFGLFIDKDRCGVEGKNWEKM